MGAADIRSDELKKFDDGSYRYEITPKAAGQCSCAQQQLYLECICYGSQIREQVDQWIAIGRRVSIALRDIAAQLEIHARNVRIARATGSSVSAAGNTAGIVGLGLTLASFGILLPLTATAFAISIGGTATSAGAQIAHQILSKRKMAEAEAETEAFVALSKQIRNMIDSLAEKSAKITDSPSTTFTGIGRLAYYVLNTSHSGHVQQQHFPLEDVDSCPVNTTAAFDSSPAMVMAQAIAIFSEASVVSLHLELDDATLHACSPDNPRFPTTETVLHGSSSSERGCSAFESIPVDNRCRCQSAGTADDVELQQVNNGIEADRMEPTSTSSFNDEKDGGKSLLADFGTKINRKLESLSFKERVGTGLGLTVGGLGIVYDSLDIYLATKELSVEKQDEEVRRIIETAAVIDRYIAAMALLLYPCQME